MLDVFDDLKERIVDLLDDLREAPFRDGLFSMVVAGALTLLTFWCIQFGYVSQPFPEVVKSVMNGLVASIALILTFVAFLKGSNETKSVCVRKEQGIVIPFRKSRSLGCIVSGESKRKIWEPSSGQTNDEEGLSSCTRALPV